MFNFHHAQESDRRAAGKQNHLQPPSVCRIRPSTDMVLANGKWENAICCDNSMDRVGGHYRA
jgi:hypothetical protein